MNGKEQDEDSKIQQCLQLCVDDEDEIKKKRTIFVDVSDDLRVKTPNNIFIIVTIVCLAIPGIVTFPR